MKTKKILAALLSSAMVLGAASIPVFAEGSTITVGNASELVSAFSSAESGSTIQLEADITDVTYDGSYLTVPQNKSITFDLNGHTIKGTATNAGTSALFKVDGTLVINDTAGGTGAIINDATQPDLNRSPSYANNAISNYGTVTVNNGTVESKVSKGGYAQYPIDNYSGSTVNINGGKIITSDNGSYYALRAFMNSDTNAVNININGGEIYGGYGVWLQPSSNSLKKVNFNMTGGYIHCKNGFAVFLGRDFGTMQGFVNISGGTIDNAAFAPEDGSNLVTMITGDAVINGLILYRNSSVAISGGNIKGLDMLNNSQVSITGGTFNSEVQPYIPTGYAEKEDNGTYTVIPFKKLMSNVADSITVKTATNETAKTYEQVTAATVTIPEINSSKSKDFTVTATDDEGVTVHNKTITLNGITVGTNYTGDGSVLCGIIITDIPEGYTVTVE